MKSFGTMKGLWYMNRTSYLLGYWVICQNIFVSLLWVGEEILRSHCICICLQVRLSGLCLQIPKTHWSHVVSGLYSRKKGPRQYGKADIARPVQPCHPDAALGHLLLAFQPLGILHQLLPSLDCLPSFSSSHVPAFDPCPWRVAFFQLNPETYLWSMLGVTIYPTCYSF